MEPGPIAVLVVDDSAGDARLVALALREEPEGAFRVESVDRVRSAVTRLSEGGIDVVLLDQHLPDGAGVEALDQVRRSAPGVPVLLHSGSEDPSTLERGLAAGADDYLVKGSLAVGELASRLRSSVVRRGILDALRSASAPPDEAGAQLDALGEGFAVVVEGGRLGYTNATFAALLGLPGAEVAHLEQAIPRLLSTFGWRGPPYRRRVADLPGVRDSPVELTWGRVEIGSGSGRSIRLRRRSTGRVPSLDVPETADADLDPRAWQALVELAGGDPAFLRSYLLTFATETGALARELEKARAGSDLAGLARVGHTLRTAARQVGARRLANLAGRLEVAGAAKENAIAQELVTGLAAELERTRVLVAARVPPPSAP